VRGALREERETIFFRVGSSSGIDADGVVMLGAGQREARETMELLKALPVDLMCELYGAALD
jgi:hypothetical protein